MVTVCITLASQIEGDNEHARTYIYAVDGTREDTQGTIRDINRGKELIGLILKQSPGCVNTPPPDDSHTIFSTYIGIVRSRRNGKSSYAMDYERHDCSSRYNDVCAGMMQDYRRIQAMMLRAAKARDAEKAEHRAKLDAIREGAEQ